MKPQAWIIGSQNANTEDRTDLQANQAWNPLEVLKAGILNGMFKKDSEQLKIISDEICNFLITAGKTIDPTNSSQMASVFTDLISEIADRANINLSNLSSTGKNIANWSSNVSNCITEIPQDIILEIDASYNLKAKAGTKVYFGDNTSATLGSNVSYGASTGFGNGQFIFAIKKSDNSLVQATINNTVSVSTNPATAYTMWYNTTDKKCYINDGSGIASEISFPIALVMHTNGTGWTNLDQIFNGFGYVGHHIYKLPNVKGLVAYGRNEDETLKSFAVASSSVQVYELPNNREDTYMYISHANTFIMGAKVSDGYPKYDANKNWCYCNSSSPYSYLPVVKFATNNSNQVTLFEIKTPFHAVDYGDLSDYVNKTGSNIISANNTFTEDNTFTKRITGYLQGYTAHCDSTLDYKYKKLATIVAKNSYYSKIIPFIISRGQSSPNSGIGLGSITLRVGATAGTLDTNLSAITITNPFMADFINDNFRFHLVYKNNTPDSSSVTIHLYVELLQLYTGIVLTPIQNTNGGSILTYGDITWYNPNNSGETSLPADYTDLGQRIISQTPTPIASDNSNNIATTAFVKNLHQQVNVLPVNPDSNVFYYIPE